MSKKMATVLIVYGLVSVGFGFLVQHLVAAPGRAGTIAGFAGGGLSLLWGAAALVGMKGRFWATLCATATTVVLLIQTVHAWSASAHEGTSMLPFRVLVTVMFILTVAMVLYLFHGERPPEFYQRGDRRPEPPRSNAPHPQSRDARTRR